MRLAPKTPIPSAGAAAAYRQLDGDPDHQLEDHGLRPELADVPSGATAHLATVSPPGSWTEPLVLTSYSDEAGAQEAKARDSIFERLGRVVSLEVRGG